MVQPRRFLLAIPPPAFRGGDTGREPLVPLHEPYVGKVAFQAVQCSQNPARLETDLSRERPGHPYYYLAHSPLVHEPAQIRGKFRARNDFEGARDYAPCVGDGDAGAYFSEVQGGDAPTTGVLQDLLPAGEALVEDLAHPGEGVGDGSEVTAAGLGHGRATTSAATEHD